MNRAHRMAIMLAQLRSERDILSSLLEKTHATLERIDPVSLPTSGLIPDARVSSLTIDVPPTLVPSPGFFLEHKKTEAVVLLNCLGLKGSVVNRIAMSLQARLATEGSSGVYLVSCTDIKGLVDEGITVEVLPYPMLAYPCKWAEAVVEFLSFVLAKYDPIEVIDIGAPELAQLCFGRNAVFDNVCATTHE